MSREKKFKKRVRERAQKTGESYSIARKHLDKGGNGSEPSSEPPLRFRLVEQHERFRLSFVVGDFRRAIAGREHALAYFNTGTVVLRLPDSESRAGLIDDLTRLSEPPFLCEAARHVLTLRELTGRKTRRGHANAEPCSLRIGSVDTYYALLDALKPLKGFDTTRVWLRIPDVELEVPSAANERRSIIADLMPLMNDSGQNAEARRTALDLLRGLRGNTPPSAIKAPSAHFSYPDGVLCKKAAAIEKLFCAPPGVVIPHFALEDRLLICVGFSLGPHPKQVDGVKVCEVIPEDRWVSNPGEWDYYYGRQVRLKRNGPLHRIGKEFALVPE